MNNAQARELLEVFAESLANGVRITTWAEAFVQEGGEPTWDAVKSVSDYAVTVQHLAAQVEKLRDQFEDITPW